MNNRIAHKQGVEPWTAILLLNPDIWALQMTDLCSSHIIVIQITTAHRQTYLLSAYFQKSDDIEIHIKNLDRVFMKLADKRIIICIDASAKSPLWGPRDADSKDEILEDYINEKILQVINKPHDIATVANEVGEG